jgi:hypothetical protein
MKWSMRETLGVSSPAASRSFSFSAAAAVAVAAAAADVINEPFAMINADDFYGRDSFAVLGRRLVSLAVDSSDYCMVGFTLANTLSDHGTVARGVCRTDDRGFLTDIRELMHVRRTADGAEDEGPNGVVRLTGQEPVSMNMWGFQPEVFPGFLDGLAEFLKTNLLDPKAEFYIPLAVDRLLKSGAATCAVLPTAAQWFGVTWQDDKPRVQAALQAIVAAGEYPSPLWEAKD